MAMTTNIYFIRCGAFVKIAGAATRGVKAQQTGQPL
jgi:hypothetical protein